MPTLAELAPAAARRWLPIAVAFTIACLGAYGAVQQDLRQTANDPQTQIAEDAAARLNGGATPSSVVSGPTVDLATSLAVQTTVVDGADRVLASTARLDGATPTPDQGVITVARANGSNTLTWQPKPAVRVALVAVPFHGDGGGVVLVGRSLRLIEEREDRIFVEMVAGGVLGLLAIFGACLTVEWWRVRSPRPGAAAS